MKKYIIYTYLGYGYVLHPNFIAASNIREAIEILCASKNSKKEFIPISDITEFESVSIDNEGIYRLVDSTGVGGDVGYLRIEYMMIKEKTEDLKWQIIAYTA